MTRLRIAVSCLMIIVAAIAVDLAVLRLLRGFGNRALFGALPMADVLAVLLATTVGRLRRRGEVPLSHVMFLLAGGMTLIFFVYFINLGPEIVYEHVLATVWRRVGGHPLINVLLVWLAFSVPMFVPALIVGWATRGYRLKLMTCIDGQSEVASRD